MSWTPPIRCTGRTYPNAPHQARCGCLGRGPGYFFCLLGPFTPPFSLFATVFVPIRWQNTTPTSGWDVQNNWVGTWSFTVTTGAQLQVWTVKEAGTWTVYGYLRTTGSGWPFRFIRYKKAFPGGFPAWPNFQQLDYDIDSGWIYGTPAQIALVVPTYGQCAANICIP